MDTLIIILAGLASVVMLAIAFLAHISVGFSCPAWVGWLAVLILAVLACVERVGAYRSRP